MSLIQKQCSDIYDLVPDKNVQLYKEHLDLYNEFNASSVGNLIDRQQDMLDSYKKATDNMAKEMIDLRNELTAKEVEIHILKKKLAEHNILDCL